MIASSLCLFLAATTNVHSFQLQQSKPTVTPNSNSALHALSDGGDRRSFMNGGVAAAASLLLPQFSAPANAADAVDYKAVAQDIMDLVKKNPDWGPSNSGTYDKATNTGGSGAGTIRFKEELAHGGNAGLAATAVKWMEPIHAKYPGLSYADLYTLGGVASIKAMGGPTIGWSSGRQDQPVDFVTPDGRLPYADSGAPLADKADADHLRSIFYRMGFNDQEIVILSGAHALGRCHTTASLLTSLKWIPKDWSGPPQYVDGGTGKPMMLPTDYVLLDDKPFLKWVKVYAKDNDKFLKDFSKSFQKLEELGTSGLTATEWV
ncbi:MAG: hypothetical protein SGARI_005520 [Bacillariaceae sp.]